MANGFATFDVRGARALRLHALLAALVLCAVGCQFLAPRPFGKRPGDPTQHADAASAPPKSDADASADAAKEIAKMLTDANWAASRRLSDEPDGEKLRWRNVTLADLLARPPQRRPDFAQYITHESPMVRINAAIALSRLGDPRGADVLADAVRSPAMEMDIRMAAAETLATLPEPVSGPRLQELLDQYGSAGDGSNAYVADLHAELLRGLARHTPAAESIEFTRALRSNSTDVRLVALQSWRDSAEGELPAAVLDLRRDPDARIRSTVVAAFAARRHPQAVFFTVEALHDVDVRVRTTAIESLGQLGGDTAIKELHALLATESGPIRGKVIEALGQLDDWDAVFDAAEDEDWPVRAAAVRALGRRPTQQSAEVVERLLSDRSRDVRTACLQAVSEWPLEQAGPLLLTAMQQPTFELRKDASEQLLERWSGAAPIGDRYAAFAHLEADRQDAMLDELQTAWRAEMGGAAKTVAATESALDQTPRLTIEVQVEIERALADWRNASSLDAQRRAIETLRMRSDVLPEALEAILERGGSPPPGVVYHELLAKVDPQFDALDLLATTDKTQRRLGATKLNRLSRKKPLRPLAVHRLAELAIAEDDSLIWRDVMLSIKGDHSPPALRLAYAAMSHPSPEVRRLACGHLGDHPDPRNAVVLLPALTDESATVVKAAVAALGQPGALEDPSPLVHLLATPDRTLRADVAAALARLGSPAGPPALERFTYDGDPSLRRQAAAVMGELGDPQFTPSLVRMLDDVELGVRVVAVKALAEVVGRDEGVRPDEPTPSLAEQISRWKRWWADERGRVAERVDESRPSARASDGTF